MKKTIFLDRDGVINLDHGYVHKIEEFEFVPGVLEACARLKAAGYELVVVTNQSGIARGFYDEEQFGELCDWMSERFEQADAALTAIYYCPHHPDKGNEPYVGECACRKPSPGMLVKAAEEFDLDLAASYMVGDKADDMRAGQAAGVKGQVLVRTGKSVTEQGVELATVVCDDLAGAASWILRQ